MTDKKPPPPPERPPTPLREGEEIGHGRTRDLPLHDSVPDPIRDTFPDPGPKPESGDGDSDSG